MCSISSSSLSFIPRDSCNNYYTNILASGLRELRTYFSRDLMGADPHLSVLLLGLAVLLQGRGLPDGGRQLLGFLA